MPEPSPSTPPPRPRPRPRRRRQRVVGVGLASVALVVALLVGVAVGYLARGEDDLPASVTLERDLPVVTLTVTAPAGLPEEVPSTPR
jgi:hypothetical protein